MFAIKPVCRTPKPTSIGTIKQRHSVEMRTLARPEIADRVENMQDYNVVFVGFPIWWYLAPTIINGFLASYDFRARPLFRSQRAAAAICTKPKRC